MTTPNQASVKGARIDQRMETRYWPTEKALEALAQPAEIRCWRCGRDCTKAFDLIHIPGRNVAVCKGGCAS